MPQAQAVVGGHVARAEAGAAEAGLDDGAALQQCRRGAGFCQLQADGHAGGIHVQGEIAVAAAAALQNIGRLADVVEQAAGAPGNDALVGPHAAIVDLIRQIDFCLGVAGLGIGLHLGENVLGVFQKFVDGPGVGGMEGQSNHRLDLRKVNLNVFIIPGVLAGMQLPIVLGPLVGLVEPLRHGVRLPDGGEAGGLCGHDIDAVAVVNGQSRDAGTGEFQHAVVDKAGGKGGLHQGDGHIVGADTPPGSPGEIHQYHLGIGDVPGVFQKLLAKLRAALAHGHGAKSPVPGVGVRA